MMPIENSYSSSESVLKSAAYNSEFTEPWVIEPAPTELLDKPLDFIFAEHLRQHLAVENATLLPIAHIRMDGAALAAMSDILRQRRQRVNHNRSRLNEA